MAFKVKGATKYLETQNYFQHERRLNMYPHSGMQRGHDNAEKKNSLMTREDINQ